MLMLLLRKAVSTLIVYCARSSSLLVQQYQLRYISLKCDVLRYWSCDKISQALPLLFLGRSKIIHKIIARKEGEPGKEASMSQG